MIIIIVTVMTVYRSAAVNSHTNRQRNIVVTTAQFTITDVDSAWRHAVQSLGHDQLSTVVIAPMVWNLLPHHLCDPSFIESFRFLSTTHRDTQRSRGAQHNALYKSTIINHHHHHLYFWRVK